MTSVGPWLVGNDVVDLREPHNATVVDRPRFLARICDPDERARVHGAAQPVTALWALFAAKEAAYKIVAKLRPGTIFAHRAFQVAADQRSVAHEDLDLHLWVEADGDRVHAIASSHRERPEAVVVAVEASVDLGIAARCALTTLLAGRLGVDERALAVVRPPRPGSWDGFGPPSITCRGQPLDVDVSLSHDGRFVAAVAALSLV